jgi:signal transduction histidine kinase
MLAGNAVREGMATETLQRFAAAVKEPVLIVDGEAVAWANGAAREIDDWLGAAEPALEARIGAVLRTQGGAGTVTLRGRAGEERSYGVAAFELPGAEAARKAFVLTPLFDNDPALLRAQSEIALARIEEVQRQLLQADRLSTIGQLAAGVAHEINNPIGYVHSNLGTLQEYIGALFALVEAHEAALQSGDPLASREEVRIKRERLDIDFIIGDLPKLLAESREGIERVTKIVHDLKDFSHAGRDEAMRPSDLHRGLESTLNIVWNDLKYKVRLEKHYGELPLVECHLSEINQVLMNLLINAGQSITERGSIVIATGAENGEAWISIADSGCGIAPDALQRIFEPFYTTKPIGRGTGLGLAIAYSIIAKHNGRIEVTSQPGAGSAFRVVLPTVQPRAAGTA